MFSRDRSKDSAGSSPAAAVPRPAPVAQPEPAINSKPEPTPAQRPVVKPSVISDGLRITGNLASGGELLIEGSITGDIHVRGLTIGTSGRVEGKIVAEEITVSGAVDGQISARMVTIGRTARVTGDVLHDVLSIESGAEFQGRCLRRPANELEAPKTAAQMAKGQKPAQPAQQLAQQSAQSQQKASKAASPTGVRPVASPKAADASAAPAR